MRFKKGDTVLIISGKDRGKRGKIDKVIPKNGKIVVTGINVAKHHLKPSRKNPHGGIVNRLAPIEAANAIIICPRCSQPTKIGQKMTTPSAKSGSATKKIKIRICRKCKESLDV